MITLDQIKKICPKFPQSLYVSLMFILHNYNLYTRQRASMFIAQLAHESAEFTVRKENLNYSRDGLLKTFPKYFNASNVDLYARQPEKIANRVYANRMGNGDEKSGDGFRYCGRGFLQLTGRSNYRACGQAMHLPLEEKPELLLEPDNAFISAVWFWKNNGLTELSDKGDIVAVTKKINGGINGLDDRKRYYEKALSTFKDSDFKS